MTLGAGYRYLMSSVARADEATRAAGLTAYYATTGTPPGQFIGAGLAGLDGRRGVKAGSPVIEEELWRMLGMLQDPANGEALGRRPAAPPFQLGLTPFRGHRLSGLAAAVLRFASNATGLIWPSALCRRRRL